jgi:hypothetical protein
VPVIAARAGSAMHAHSGSAAATAVRHRRRAGRLQRLVPQPQLVDMLPFQPRDARFLVKLVEGPSLVAVVLAIALAPASTEICFAACCCGSRRGFTRGSP